MTPRAVLAALAATLAVAACTGESGADPLGPEGRLVVLDEEGNVVTLDPDGSNRVQITDDGAEVRHFQPVWSPDSPMIAWGVGRSSGNDVGLADAYGENVSMVPVAGFPFYLYWAPGGERLGILHNAETGSLEFEILDVEEGTALVVDAGSPYYFSWSPDGSEVVVHVGGNRLAVIDGEGSDTDLGATSPEYLAPLWTDAGIFYVTTEGLALRPDDGSSRIVASAQGFVSFTANPGGSRVAIQVIGPGPATQEVSFAAVPMVTRGTVSVVDPATEEITVASETASLGFFWSPDGDKLLMLIPTSFEGDVDVVIWEEDTAQVMASLRLPVSLLRDALQFGDQYFQSIQLWSPASDAVAVPGRIDDEGGVWVIPIDGSDPELVSDGDWVSWSG